MESNNKSAVGTVATYGELVANKLTLKKIRDCKILNQTTPLPKSAVTISVEVGGNLPIAGQFIHAKWNVGLQVPVDINQVDLAEAYEQAKSIVMLECAELVKELKAGVFVRETTEEDLEKDPDLG